MQTVYKLMLALFAALLVATAAIWIDISSYTTMWLIGQAGPNYPPSNSSFNATYVNATIAKAAGFVNLINSSAYLFFRANLSSAYHYINLSVRAYNRSDGQLSIHYANLAQQSAQDAYSRISAYKYDSGIVMAIFTLFIGAILYIHMRPIRKPDRKEKAKR